MLSMLLYLLARKNLPPVEARHGARLRALLTHGAAELEFDFWLAQARAQLLRRASP